MAIVCKDNAPILLDSDAQRIFNVRYAAAAAFNERRYCTGLQIDFENRVALRNNDVSVAV